VLTYQWAFTSVPAGSAASLSGAASVAASFTPDFVGTYVLSLTVTDPSGVSSTDSVTVTAVTPMTVTVETTDDISSENSDNGVFRFTRAGSTAAPLVVRYTLGGGATNGADYNSLSGTVTIPAGQATANVTIVPINDSAFEGPETVDITVAPDAAYTVGSPAAARLTIDDNDRPMVSIRATDNSANESGDTGTFTITRTGPTTAELRVTFAITGTATNGVDYAALASPVIIPIGESSVTLTVSPVDDGPGDGSETVNVTLTSNTGVTVAPSPNNTARVTIVGP
jgi:Calx-beta domain-containing protein/K319-like protein